MKLTTYKFELSTGDAGVAIEKIVESAAEVQELVAESLWHDSVLIVTHLKHSVDYGNFIIFVNTVGSTHVRLLEHRGFFATALQTAPTGRFVHFMNDGCPFEVDENAAIPVATAKAALNHWLATGQQYPGVCWVDE